MQPIHDALGVSGIDRTKRSWSDCARAVRLSAGNRCLRFFIPGLVDPGEMALADTSLFAGWSGADRAMLLAALAVGALTVGYEAGGVLAGKSFEPLALVPVLGVVVTIAALYGDKSPA